MLHLGPGASRKRVPPSPDVPSGNTLGSITRRSHKSPPSCSPRASTIPGSLSLASSGHFHAPRPGGRRAAVPAPPVPLRFTAARLTVHPPPQRCSAPRPAASCSCLTSCLRPQDSRSDAARKRIGKVYRVIGPLWLARPPPGATASSAVLVIPGASSASAFVPHSVAPCSLVIPAGSLDPAPCGGKEHLSVLRSQNPVFTGFAKYQQPPERGSSNAQARVPGEVGWASIVQAVIC